DGHPRPTHCRRDATPRDRARPWEPRARSGARRLRRRRLTPPMWTRIVYFARETMVSLRRNVADVTPDMQIYREETFGPIAPVIVFDTDDDAIEMANDTEYGLASYVYTNSLSRAFHVMERLKFGMVGVNDINP